MFIGHDDILTLARTDSILTVPKMRFENSPSLCLSSMSFIAGLYSHVHSCIFGVKWYGIFKYPSIQSFVLLNGNFREWEPFWLEHFVVAEAFPMLPEKQACRKWFFQQSKRIQNTCLYLSSLRSESKFAQPISLDCLVAISLVPAPNRSSIGNRYSFFK